MSEPRKNSFIHELQIIWDEVGESETDKDRMLFELEEECIELYRRKVDQANWSRVQLRQEIADCEAELATICSALAERPIHIRQDQNVGSLKQELARIYPELEEMRKRKSDRRNQLIDVREQIQSISNELYSPGEHAPPVIDENDLSLRKLEELHRQLYALQKEKSDRLKTVQDHLRTLNSLCSVLGLDFKETIDRVHPSLGNSEGYKSIDNDTIKQMTVAIQDLREIKLQRMEKLQDIATTMLELWHLMDTPVEEQQMFQNVTCNIAASEDEITEPNTLSEGFISHVEEEVLRLEALKSSKMKELVLKKRAELEEICQKTHLVPELDSALEYAIETIESGTVDPAWVLEQLELHIAKVKEEAFSRKDILEKVEKWLSACEEESWLEEYNKDENRYNAGRGTHLNLKRAEKARALVTKIPGMVEALNSKTTEWEQERGIEFKYDDARLLSMLEDYTNSRQGKEQERRKLRNLKKHQGQLIAEQEVLYGSKPSPKANSAKKLSRQSSTTGSGRRTSLGASSKLEAKATHSYFSSAKTGVDIAHSPLEKTLFGSGSVRKIDSPSARQPFSPISSTESSKANSASTTDELKMQQTEELVKTLTLYNMPFTSPSKTSTVVDEENKTPKAMPFSLFSSTLPPNSSNESDIQTQNLQKTITLHNLPFSTPSKTATETVVDEGYGTPKVMAIPVPTTPSSVPFGGYSAQETEYSFEERRLGCVFE
ncbi:65-kDa microtubule-associated protein 3-like isoform X1 [Arachis ipaensis]|uniref:65-kDa microtubule-associated protein 3-like isoform X1 n=1 Tax=Arachis ipaensis TaxID=130454 RepID=UPI0007AF1B79|nr:65-kDa microtubule-associated protein 3-like isoform X1 [Arachis ipaensis]